MGLVLKYKDNRSQFFLKNIDTSMIKNAENSNHFLPRALFT